MKEKIKNLDKETKRRIKKLTLSIFVIIILISGLSYAFVKINYTSKKEESINSCFDITMTDNGELSLNNAIPTQDTIGVNTNPYKYKITNTCDMDAYYETTINVLSPSVVSDASKVRVALYGDGYLTPSTLSSLKTGEVTANFANPLTNSIANHVIDEGYLPAKTSKEFNLAMWIGYDVTEFNNVFNSQILVTGIAKEAETLTNLSGGATVLKANTINKDYDYTKVTSGLYYQKRNDDIDTFYFRGTNQNNNFSFMNKDWKIVRINKDGSIKLVLNDSIGTSTYQNIDTTLNTWYNSNIKGKDYEKYIVQDNYCNDQDFAYKRVVTNNKPRIKCTNNTKKSIGVLSVDEVMLSSAVYNSTNKTSYLDSNTNTYTLTPAQSANDAFSYGGTKQISIVNKTTSLGIRPTITITKDAVISGEGSTSNKYSVNGIYSNLPEAYNDTTKPTIEMANVTQKWTNTGKEITISGYDESKGSGVGAYNVTTTSAIPASNDNNWVSMTSAKVTTTTKYNAGTYYVWVKDKSNNISTSKTVTVDKIDTTKPTCTLTYTKSGNGYRLKITGQDNNQLAGKPYSFDGTNYQELSTKVVGAGNHTAYVKDIAGNVNTCTLDLNTPATKFALANVNTGGLEIVNHEIDDTLQVDNKFATEYRYRGGSVNNYVTFNNETWRIIGIIPIEDTNGNVEGRFKIIRDESIGDYNWDSDTAITYNYENDDSIKLLENYNINSNDINNLIDYNSNYNIIKKVLNISCTNCENNWARPSVLNTYLNDTYYNSLSFDAKNMIGTTKYYLGGYNDVPNITSDVMWQYERKNDANRSGYYYGTNPVIQSDASKKIALMYASDYGYGASKECTSTLYDYRNSTNCKTTNNWLDKSQYEWLLPQSSGDIHYALIVNSDGCVFHKSFASASDLGGVRPVLSLSSNVKISGGEGTSSNPYTLSVS